MINPRILVETNYLDPFYFGFTSGYKTEIVLVALVEDLDQNKRVMHSRGILGAFITINHPQ